MRDRFKSFQKRNLIEVEARRKYVFFFISFICFSFLFFLHLLDNMLVCLSGLLSVLNVYSFCDRPNKHRRKVKYHEKK